MNPDSCIPRNYTGYGDNECFSNCPVNCGINDMLCSGGTDQSTGNYIFQYGLKCYISTGTIQQIYISNSCLDKLSYYQ